ncbi:MAG: hypothetical protein LBI28_04470, partial [Treponema sp.]|nr:hypothetical protein [Treponema sp.]
IVFTDDLNLKKLEKVFYDFKSPPINVEILKEEKGYLFIGSPPLRIEVISNADGINIKDCYKRKNIVEIDNVKINIISKDDLITNKKSTNRLKDHSDAEVLENYKINPNINTKNILKLRLILSNIVGAYGKQLEEERADIKKRKKDNNYKNDLNIVNKTILLYNKALDTKSENDVFALHNSFKKNPLTDDIYDIFRYKILRNKIYNEIEYRFKLLLKNEYSYLINNKNSNGGRK